MNVWIFQGKPERYPLKEKLVKGDEETWLVTRYRDQITKDDVVLFWSAGDRDIRGLYGWGIITEDVPKYYENWGYGISVTYEERFRHHISISKIEESGILNNNPILKMPVGTNFKLTEEEAAGVIALIKECEERAPSLTTRGENNG